MAEALLVAAGQQAGPGRAAIRAGDVAARAADAVLGERVDVRRGDVLAAVHADVGVAEVVGQEDEMLGLRLLSPAGSDGGEQGETQQGQEEALVCTTIILLVYVSRNARPRRYCSSGRRPVRMRRSLPPSTKPPRGCSSRGLHSGMHLLTGSPYLVWKCVGGGVTAGGFCRGSQRTPASEKMFVIKTSRTVFMNAKP